MKVYNYDPFTRYYMGSEDADENPMRPGDYILPANATFVQPPKFSRGFIPKWNNTSWELIDLTQFITWDQIRNTRNNFLFQTDWTQLPDVELKNKDEWKTYRQELRDLTKKYESPRDVKFPIIPKLIS